MSDLKAVYDALAAVPVALAGRVVTVRNVDALPASVAAADVPLRLLMPLGTRPGATAVSEVALTGIATAQWRLTDLLLLRPAQAGKLEEAAALLVEYQSAYVTALMRARMLNRCPILGIAIDCGVGPYPMAGGVDWYGAQATVTVQEVWK